MNWTWIITPVGGAFLGYITNVVAIKMLFRPHNEKRIFGWKLPFTPGLIPKEKYKLSQKIGETLAKNVLTEEELVEAVSSPDVMDKLMAMLDGFLVSLKDGAYDGQIDEICEVLSEKLSAVIMDRESTFNMALLGVIERIEQTGFIYKILDTLKSNSNIVADYMPDEIPERLMRFIMEKTPNALTFLHELPERYPDVDEKLGQLVQKIAEENFGAFLGIFVKYDQLYEKIKASVCKYMEDTDNTRFLAFKAAAFLDGYMRKPVGELVSKIPEDTLNGIAEKVASKAGELNPSELLLRFVPEPKRVIKNLLKGSISAIINGLNNGGATKLRDFAVKALRLIAGKGGAYVVSSIRFDQLVENKLNAFSVAEAEDMIISVVDRESKAITWFGGVLGFIIGFLPLIINAVGV